MFTVFVRLEVHPEALAEFTTGIRDNATASLLDEPGCIRFDVHQDADIPTRFYFYEIYSSRDAFEVEHKRAPHYAQWRQVVQRCVVPGTQHNTYGRPLFPDDIPEYAAVRFHA